MPTTVAQVQAEVSADISPLKRSMKEAGDTTDQASSMFDGLGGMLAKLAVVGGVAAAGFGILKVGVIDSVNAAQNDQQVQAQLANTLMNLGTQTNVTAEEVNRFAENWSQITPNSKDAIISVEQFMLQTNHLSQKVLPQATQVIMDMSASLGISLTTASKQVARELEHPEKAFALLSKQGIVLDDTTQKLIKSMVKHGDIAGAQQIILGKLGDAYDNASTAAGKTFGGSMEILRHDFEEMQVKIGNAIIPLLAQLAQAVMPVVESLMQGMVPATNLITGLLQNQLAPIITGKVIPIITQLAQFVTTNLMPAFLHLADTAGHTLLPMVIKLAEFLTSNFVPVLMLLAGFVISRLVPVLQGLWSQFASKILPVVISLGETVIRVLLPPLERLIASIMGQLVPALAKLWEKISPILIPVFNALGGILANVVGPAFDIIINVLGVVISAISTLIDWIAKLIGWLGQAADKVGGFFNKLGKAKDFLGNLIPHFATGTQNAPGGAAIVGENGPELVYLPRGSQVVPNNQLGLHTPGGNESTGGDLVLQMDGYTLARVAMPYIFQAFAAKAGIH